jgi:hypothetical protein
VSRNPVIVEGSGSPGRRTPPVLGMLCVAGALILGATGCSHHPLEKGWSNPLKVQVQFYEPPGATVALRDWGIRRHQISTYDALDHRLEMAPEEFAVYNLCPGKYDFKYTTAEGFEGASIYGELQIHGTFSDRARKFVRHSFIPIALHSKYASGSDERFFPTMGASGVGLPDLETQHLKQGDVVEKVYFIADLQKAWETIRAIDLQLEKLRSAEIVLNSSLEYYDARYEDYRRESIYADPTYSPDDKLAEIFGFDREFNRIEGKRQKLLVQRYKLREQRDDLMQERRIRKTLLDSMDIIHRRGAMVLATPENQWPFHDTAEQVEDARHSAGAVIGPWCAYTVGGLELEPLGELIAEVRVGGRHKHWDDPRGEMVAFQR